MWRNFFKRRPKKILGIDLGTSAIKIIELRRGGRKGVILENYGETNASFLQNNRTRFFQGDSLLISDQNKIGRAIAEICREAGIVSREANFSIPDFSSFFTAIELPLMSEDEVPEAIRYEVRPYIPLPISEITLDWAVVEGIPGKSPLKVLVVAIPNDVISQYQEIASAANLKLKILEPEVFSLARAAIRDQDAQKIILLIDIGARSTTCNILEKGIVKRSYSFNVGGNELTGVLAKSLSIGYNEAEELKRKYGVQDKNDTTEEQKANVRKILLPLLDSIISEAKKVLRSFYQDEGKETEKIILAGGVVVLPGLKDYFSSEFGKPSAVANPFSYISHQPLISEILKERGPSYAVAAGVALKGFE